VIYFQYCWVPPNTEVRVNDEDWRRRGQKEEGERDEWGTTAGCDSEKEHNMGLACDWDEWKRKVEAQGGRWQMMTNSNLSSFPSLLSSNPYLALLSPQDQQGVGWGGFSGGQRSISPGSVALGALHCLWNHHVYLCHRRIDFLPVWKTTIKATTRHTHTHTHTIMNTIANVK